MKIIGPKYATRRRTSCAALAVLAAALSIGVALPSVLPTPIAHAATKLEFASPEAAYENGLGAVRAGKLDLAVEAFEFAGEHNHVPALYYLGTIYANNDEQLTDHAKAFNVFHRIVERHAYVDPVSDYRSVYVVRAAVRLADYYRLGVPALNLKPDPRGAVELLNHAATYFGDLEAQFQLAKMHLSGDGVEGNARYGLHWLSRLAHKNHAGAQAFLAELMWRGKFVQKDPNQALVWSTLSVEAAGDQDRIWIEEVHQTIFCGAPAGVRERAGQLVADWRRRAPVTATAPPTAGSASGVSAEPETRGTGATAPVAAKVPNTGKVASTAPHLATIPVAARTCANGEAVPSVVPGGTDGTTGTEMPSPGMRGDLPAGAAPLPAPLPVIDKNSGLKSPMRAEPFQPSKSEPVERTVSAPAAVTSAPAAFGQGFTEFGAQAPRRR